MKNVYHLFSDGALTSDLFVLEQEFIDAVNRLAVSAFLFHVVILGFSLQDTHFHVLVRGEYSDVERFRIRYQKLTNEYLHRYRHDSDTMKFKVEMCEVTDESYLKNVAIYVICQATKDGKRVMPYDYLWSSATLYFRNVDIDLLWITRLTDGNAGLCCVRDIPLRTQRLMLRTNQSLPEDWRVYGGLILPSSFVDIESFESIFGTPNAFRVFCGSSRKSDMEVLNSMGDVTGIFLEEQEARVIVMTKCNELYHTSNTHRLNTSQRLELARCVWREYKMGIAQLARRVHVPERTLRNYLK